MTKIARRLVVTALPAVALSACAGGPSILGAKPHAPRRDPALHAGATPEMIALVDKWADHYEVPRDLVHAQVRRESGYRADARNGPYWGLMQILPQTARTMGFDGPAEALLDPNTNLKYAVKYLRGAWLVSGGDRDAAMGWYAKGYYYEAKRLGMLEQTGLV